MKSSKKIHIKGTRHSFLKIFEDFFYFLRYHPYSESAGAGRFFATNDNRGVHIQFLDRTTRTFKLRVVFRGSKQYFFVRAKPGAIDDLLGELSSISQQHFYTPKTIQPYVS
jgi:hypothetical protein